MYCENTVLDLARAACMRSLRLSCIAAACVLVSCGGGGGGGYGGPPVVPVAVEFEVLAGGGACNGDCGGDSGDGGGVGSGADGGDGAGGGLGQMRHVRVLVRKPDGTALGSAVLQGNLVSLYPRTYKGAFILEFVDDGSGTGEYYDEARKAWVSLGGQKLHVLVPSLTHHVSANPLTEAAYQWAISQHGSEAALTADRMSEANATVLAAFNARVPAGYAISDITNYAQAVSDTTAGNSLSNTHAGRYGTLLAGLPRVASSFNPALAAPGLAFLTQVVADITDDGLVNSSAAVDPAVQAYGPDVSHALADSVESARADYGAPTQPTPTAAPSVCFNLNALSVGTTIVATFDETDDQGVTSPLTTSQEVRRRTTSFLGLDAIEMVVSGDGADVFQYLSPDFSAGIVSYGAVINSTLSGAAGETTAINRPPTVSRMFQLRPGESETILQAAEVTSRDATGAVVFGPTVTTNSVTTTFAGFEDVVVPAGVFKSACKIVSVSTSTDTAAGTFITTDTTWWAATGQFVIVRSEDRSESTVSGSTFVTSSSRVLRAATVNGVPVR